MKRPSVYADFNNSDTQGRVRLNCVGTIEDLSRLRVTLAEGQLLTLADEALEVDGEVLYSPEEGLWVAVIDWEGFRPLKPKPALPVKRARAAATRPL